MEIVYRPAGGQEQVFPIDFDDLDLEEFGLIETYSGKTYEQIAMAFSRSGMGSSAILRALLFVYLRRQDPEIHYRDVKPKVREVQMRLDLAELLELKARVEADPKYPARKQVLAELEDDIAEARARGGAGKDDSSPTPESSTEAPSPKRGKATEPSST